MLNRSISIALLVMGTLLMVAESSNPTPLIPTPNAYIFIDKGLSTPSFFVFTEGDITQESYDQLYYMYDKLPYAIKSTFFANGWTLVLTDKSLEQQYWTGNYIGEFAGLTVYHTKTIYISAKEASITCSTIHEFGHYLDSISGMVSRTPEFIACYEREKDTSALRDYAKISAMEFLAESFELYVLNEDIAREVIPDTVVFIEKMLDM